MPWVYFQGREIPCVPGANLRRVLLQHGRSPYNGRARQLNCRGLGSCGTCAVEVRGKLSPPTFMERWRLNFPPHRKGLQKGLRLACQCRVLEGEVVVEKKKGFWGAGE